MNRPTVATSDCCGYHLRDHRRLHRLLPARRAGRPPGDPPHDARRRPRCRRDDQLQLPTITLDDRPLIYFAGWKRHVSVYPIPDGDETYESQLSPYRSGASTARFPLAKPIPYDLIAQITILQRDQRDR